MYPVSCDVQDVDNTAMSNADIGKERNIFSFRSQPILFSYSWHSNPKDHTPVLPGNQVTTVLI